MSRIGNKEIEIPDKVRVSIDNDGAVSVEGPKGKLNWKLPRDIRATVKDNRVSLMREAETRSVKALHGLSRSLVHNMVQGVSQGFTKQLEIEGVVLTLTDVSALDKEIAGLKQQIESRQERGGLTDSAFTRPAS